jgi:hypothetical protein
MRAPEPAFEQAELGPQVTDLGEQPVLAFQSLDLTLERDLQPDPKSGPLPASSSGVLTKGRTITHGPGHRGDGECDQVCVTGGARRQVDHHKGAGQAYLIELEPELLELEDRVGQQIGRLLEREADGQ